MKIGKKMMKMNSEKISRPMSKIFFLKNIVNCYRIKRRSEDDGQRNKLSIGCIK